MSNYEKQNFQSGQILTAAQLNHIEEGIEKILPAIENDASGKILSLNENGILVWKDEGYGYIIEEQLLIEEMEISPNTISYKPLIDVEIGDEVTAYLNGKAYKQTVSMVYDFTAGEVKGVEFSFENRKSYTFFLNEPGLVRTGHFSEAPTGTIKLMVKTKKYNKLNYKYLPICSIAGEGWNSVNLNNFKHTIASGTCSFAANGGNAENDYSTAINFGTAKGLYSFASGQSEAQGVYSHSEGFLTIATGMAQHVEGKYNIKDTEEKYAHIVGNGFSKYNSELNKNELTYSNAYTLDWSGNAWFAGTVEGTAMILSSPNGTRFQITVSDDGTLSATQIVE